MPFSYFNLVNNYFDPRNKIVGVWFLDLSFHPVPSAALLGALYFLGKYVI